MEEKNKIIDVKRLTAGYYQNSVFLPVITEVDCYVNSGEVVGLIGESGSGKTTCIDALLGILPYKNGQIQEGQLQWVRSGADIWTVVGREITYIPQDPNASLDPFFSIRTHFYEIIQTVTALKKSSEIKAYINQLLNSVELDPDVFNTNSFPHQLSGGMKQRILIALALISDPKLIIADEPTSNLDVTTEKSIIDLFLKIIRQKKTSLLITTHNLRVAKRICDRLYVLREGKVVEAGTTDAIFTNPQHEYTRTLIASM